MTDRTDLEQRAANQAQTILELQREVERLTAAGAGLAEALAEAIDIADCHTVQHPAVPLLTAALAAWHKATGKDAAKEND